MLVNDGDIIRGLGFVTLYSAYMEEMIGDFLSLLNENGHCDIYDQRWPISRKTLKAISVLRDGSLGDQAALISTLEKASSLFEKRNEVVHGRIYAGHENRDILKSGRPNVPDRPVDSEELYILANDLISLRGVIYSQVIQIRDLQTLFIVP